MEYFPLLKTHSPLKRKLLRRGLLSLPKVPPPTEVQVTPPKGTSTTSVPVMDNIRGLIEEKERELSALSGRRVQGLEARAKGLAEELRKKEAETAILHSQLAQLTSDFKYNLKLLDERDGELEKQDNELASLRSAVGNLEKQLQDIRREAGEWREEAQRREQRAGELEEAVGAYQEVVAKVRDQLEDAKRMRDEEVAKQASEMGVLKAHLLELNAQHEADIEAAVQRAGESFRAERVALEKRVAELKGIVEETEERKRREVQALRGEIEEAKNKGNERIAEERERGRREVESLRIVIEGLKSKTNDVVLEEREKGLRETQILQIAIDDLNVKAQKREERFENELELLEKKLGSDYQAALLRLQEEHGADVIARGRAHERERELVERKRAEEEEERLTLGARLESAEKEVRSSGVKWEERVRALQEERKQVEQHAQAALARIAELEGVTSSQARELEKADGQSRMLQTLVDDLHVALQEKEESIRGLHKKVDDLRAEKEAATTSLEREKAEAEAALRQQLLDDYESKVAELLDTLRTMKEHVASESDRNLRDLGEQMDRHEAEVRKLEGLLEESQQKKAEMNKECEDLKGELVREKEDAQFVKSTLAARDAEVELLRGEVESIRTEVEKLSSERVVWKREEKIRTEEVSKLRVELSAREAEVERLAEMLEAARTQNEGLGFRVNENRDAVTRLGSGQGLDLKGEEQGSEIEGLRNRGQSLGLKGLESGKQGLGVEGLRETEGFGGLGEEGFALLRRLAAENEDLKGRLLGGEKKGQNHEGSIGLRATEESGQTERILKQYAGGGVRTLPDFANGPEASGIGGHFDRGFTRNENLNQGKISSEKGGRMGAQSIGRVAFLAESATERGARSLRSHVPPAVAKLQEEMRAVRRSVEALRLGHVALLSDGRHVSLELASPSEGRHVSPKEGAVQSKGGFLLAGAQQEGGLYLGRAIKTGESLGELSLIQEELLTLRREVDAAKRGAMLGGESVIAPFQGKEAEDGLQVLREELTQLRTIVQSIAGFEREKEQRERNERSRKKHSEVDGRIEEQLERGEPTKAEAVGLLENLKGSVADLRAELDTMQQNRERELAQRQVDAPFGGFASSVSHESNHKTFPSGFGSPIATGCLKEDNLGGRAVTVRNGQEMTSSVAVGETNLLREQVAQLAKELLLLKSGSILREQQNMVEEPVERGKNGSEAYFGSHERNWASEAVAKMELDRSEGGGREGAERNRTERKDSAPSALLQREIADVRAELAALRNGRDRTEPRGPEWGGTPEWKGGFAKAVPWGNENKRTGVEQLMVDVSAQLPNEETGKRGYAGRGSGAARAPLLTWTDLATCLGESEKGQVALVVNTGQVGASVQRQTGQRSKAGDSAIAYERPLSAGNGSSISRSWVPSSGGVAGKVLKPGAKAMPRGGPKATGTERKEKQNKVGYGPKASWTTPSSVFQVVKK